MSGNPLGYEKESKLLKNLAIPCIISMLVSALYNIVDQMFIGQGVGIVGNAATNVAFPLSTICTALSLLIGIGGASRFSLNLGAGDKEEAERYAGNGMVMMGIAGITLTIITQLFLMPMLQLFGAKGDVLHYAAEYTRIVSLGFPFLIANTGLSKLILADGSARYSMLSVLAGAVINTILDPLFIFVFRWGMSGAALATILGQIFSFGMSVYYMMHFKAVTFTKKSFKLRKKHCMEIISLGAGSFVNQIAMTIVQIAMNNTLTYYGALSAYGDEIPLACAGIITKVNAIYMALVIGVGQGGQPIIGFNYGAKKYGRVKTTYLLEIRTALMIGVVAFMCFQMFPRQIISLFGSGDEMYFAFAERYFRIFLFMVFVNGMQPIATSFFTAIGKPKLGIFMSLTRQILFLLPLIIIFPLIMGIDGVMYAGPIADVAAAVVAGLFSIKMIRELTEKQKNIDTQ